MSTPLDVLRSNNPSLSDLSDNDLIGLVEKQTGKPFNTFTIQTPDPVETPTPVEAATPADDFGEVDTSDMTPMEVFRMNNPGTEHYTDTRIKAMIAYDTGLPMEEVEARLAPPAPPEEPGMFDRLGERLGGAIEGANRDVGRILEGDTDIQRKAAIAIDDSLRSIFGSDEPKVADDPDAPAKATDYVRAMAGGVNSIVSGAGFLAEATGLKTWGKDLRALGDKGAAYWNDTMTAGGQVAAGEMPFEDDEDSLIGVRLTDNWKQSLGMATAGSVPTMLAAALPGALITKGLQSLASLGITGTSATQALLAGTAAPITAGGQVISRIPSAVGFGAAEGLVAGSMNAAGFKSAIEAMPEEELDKSPVYLALKLEHGPEIGRQLLADQASIDLFGKTAAATGAIGAITGGGALGAAYQRATDVAKGGIFKEVLGGAAREAGQEFPQSGSEALLQNIATRDYLDPTQDITEGVLAEALTGAAAGAAMGAGVGGTGVLVSRTNAAKTKADKINRDREKLNLQKIQGAQSVDEAIAATEETIGQKPVTARDVDPQAAAMQDVLDTEAYRADLLKRAETSKIAREDGAPVQPPAVEETVTKQEVTGPAIEAAQTEAAKAVENPELLKSFAGRKAKGADLTGLAEANRRLAKGEHPGVILEETGWRRGVDKKWRFEIDDSGSEIKKPWPTKGQPFGDMFDVALTEKRKTQPDVDPGKVEITIGEVLDHPKLFEAYPEIADLPLRFKAGTGAYYARAKNGLPEHIAVGRDEPMSIVRSALLHEIQHGIQTVEGFAKGGNVGTVKKVKAKAIDEVTDLTSKPQVALSLRDITLLEEKMAGKPQEEIDAATKKLSDKLAKKNPDYAEYVQAVDRMDFLGMDETPVQGYLRLAGEVEARNVQERMTMTKKEREMIPPSATQDVPDTKAIVLPQDSEPTVANMEDYRGSHGAPDRGEGNAPLHELDRDVYPDDVYSTKAAQYYGSGDAAADKRAIATLQSLRGKPDQQVKVYRAIPAGSDAGINPGDWVSIDRGYAEMHGERTLNGKYELVEQSVKAGDLYTNGDSIFEQGYDPEEVPAPKKAAPKKAIKKAAPKDERAKTLVARHQELNETLNDDEVIKSDEFTAAMWADITQEKIGISNKIASQLESGKLSGLGIDKKVMLSRDPTASKNEWRITYLDKNNEPSGHSEYPDIKEAVSDFLNQGQGRDIVILDDQLATVEGVTTTTITQDGKEFETGKPVTFAYLHNTSSATKAFGKPKKGDTFKRHMEPSGKYMTMSSSLERATEQAADRKEITAGEVTFNNPLVIEGGEDFNWKKELFKKYGTSGKKLSQALIADGYDGVVTVDGAGRTPFVSEILDLTTFDEKKALYSTADIKKDKMFFSETNAAGDLLIQHNLSAANLIHADKIGGIPVPSLAIAKKTEPLAGFGEITLLGGVDMATPKPGTKVFGADVHSTRYPAVNYRFDKQGVQIVNNALAEAQEVMGSDKLSASDLEDNPVRQLSKSAELMYAFLKSNGVEPKIKKQQMPKIAKIAKPFRKFAKMERVPMSHEFVQDQANRDAMVKDFKETHPGLAELDDTSISNLLRHNHGEIERYRRDKKTVGKADRYETEKAIRKQVSAKFKTDDVEQFANRLVARAAPEERIFKGHTPYGDRRYMPHTLDNVLKLMKKLPRGGETFNFGAGSVRARFTPELKSIKAIRARKDTIISDKDFDAVQEESNMELINLGSDFAYAHPTGKKMFGMADVMTEVMYDVAAGYSPRSALKNNGFDVDMIPDGDLNKITDFADKLRNMPTEYFEALIFRNVQVSEFKAAVVPKTIGADAKEALKRQGITRIKTYDPNKDGDRAAQIGKFEDLFFSKTESVADTVKAAPRKRIVGMPADMLREGIADMVAEMDINVEVFANTNAINEYLAENGYDEKLGTHVDGVYDASKDTAYIIASNVPTLDRAKWIIIHEVVGHGGLRALNGPVADTVAKAGENKFIQKLAQAISENREEDFDARVHTEEAIAELAAANLTGNFDAIKRRYNVEIPKHARTGVRNLIQRVIEAIRRVIAKLTGGPVTDGQIADLIENLQRAVRKSATTGDKDLVFSARSTKDPALPEITRTAEHRMRFQDKMLRFKEIQKWAKEQGTDLTEAANVYERENISKGVTANKIDDFRKKELKPLIDEMATAKIEIGDVTTYLEAKHIPEANARMRLIHKMADATANGVTDAQAKEITDKYEARADFKKFEEFANRIRGIGEATLDARLEAGLLTQEMYDNYKGTYKLWVPLRGNIEAEGGKGAGTGKGLSVSARQQRRFGHKARDNEFVLENLILDREKAIMQIEKNKVALSVLDFLVQAENENIGTIGKPELRQGIKDFAFAVTLDGRELAAYETEQGAKNAINKLMNGEGKLSAKFNSVTINRNDFKIVKSYDPRVTTMANPTLGDNEIQAYVNGHAVRMQLNDPHLARGATNSEMEQIGTVLAGARKFNAFLSKAYTAWSPDFLLVNPVRDIYSGVLVLTGKKGALFSAKAMKNYPFAIAELWKHRNDPTKSKWIKDFRDHGGNIGAAYLSDIERIGEDAMQAYREMAGARDTYRSVYNEEIAKGSTKKRANTKALLKAGMSKIGTLPVVGHFLNVMEKINGVTENALRLATYKAAVESGETRQKAATLSKDLMNFNRKGELTSQASALYLFFNPGMQGAHIFAEALFTSPHRAQVWGMLAGLTTLSFLLAEIARSGDEEDEEMWKNTPAHIKDRNMVIQLGDGKQYIVPVAYGFGIFHSTGNILNDLYHGKDPLEASVAFASAMFENFSVFGNPILEGSASNDISPSQILPTHIKMLAAMDTNTDGLGRQITPTKFSESLPDSQNMFRSVRHTAYADMAAFLNSATGGTQYTPGAVDVSPNTLKYWVTTLTGGVGRFASDVTTGSMAALRGAGVPETANIPVIRKFYREPGVTDARAGFWTAAHKMRNTAEQINRALKEEPLVAREMMEQHPGVIAMAKYSRSVSKLAGAKRDAIESINNNEDIPIKTRKQEIRRMELEEQRLYEQFLKVFRAKTK
jgi:hypothetical protein